MFWEDFKEHVLGVVGEVWILNVTIGSCVDGLLY
jgi:hypothetical protein